MPVIVGYKITTDYQKIVPLICHFSGITFESLQAFTRKLTVSLSFDQRLATVTMRAISCFQ